MILEQFKSPVKVIINVENVYEHSGVLKGLSQCSFADQSVIDFTQQGMAVSNALS
jgi:hypothetical protein